MAVLIVRVGFFDPPDVEDDVMVEVLFLSGTLGMSDNGVYRYAGTYAVCLRQF